MLNTTIHKHESKVVAVTQVVEKTVSPDKVTDMYDAIRKEVRESFVKEFLIESNEIKGIVVEIHDKFATNTRVVLTRFFLNSKEYFFENEIRSSKELTKADLFGIFAQHYSQEIESQIMKAAAITVIQT